MENPSLLTSGSSGPLFPYIDLYLAQLKEQGYAAGSFYEQIHILKHAIAGLRERVTTCATWTNPFATVFAASPQGAAKG